MSPFELLLLARLCRCVLPRLLDNEELEYSPGDETGVKLVGDGVFAGVSEESEASATVAFRIAVVGVRFLPRSGASSLSSVLVSISVVSPAWTMSEFSMKSYFNLSLTPLPVAVSSGPRSESLLSQHLTLLAASWNGVIKQR